ncbi:MAG TPA: pyrroloquinoline quinone biosynthesis peptide chaperone PqqD [Chloroflexota bacterium]|nr:pyrroloquinoline quinone biosynthesis peptide chaperone PqqD [Chloroflexota bacterium]
MSGFNTRSVPRLAARTRLRHDDARDADVLLYPEGVLVLNPSAAAILKHCDGIRNVEEIGALLAAQFGGADVTPDVLMLLDRLAARGLVEGYAED